VDRCCLCKRDGETVNHLLLHCDMASTLWIHVFSRFGMSWVMPKRVIDLFACWWKSGRPRSAAVWKMVPGEFYGGYFSFVFSYVVSVDGGLFVTHVD
jgi:hypothetical protein